jgi:dipeptidyl aminopeptidase/acylaminoacyl peptidase
VLPHGGPAGRDVLDFNYWTQFLASRGWAVLQVNFRGSSGYGDEFLQAGFKRWGLEMQDDLTDAAQYAIDQGIADPERICIVGGSYGGYAALMGIVKTPELFVAR